MSMGDLGGVQNRATLEAMKEVGKDTAQEVRSEQAVADKSAQAANVRTAFRAKVNRPPKTLKSRSKKVTKMMKMKDKAKSLLPVKQIGDKASQFQQKNPELKAKTLVILRELIKPGDTKEEILAKIQKFFPDVSLADEAFEFLLETTEGELYQQVLEAKDEFNQNFGREITAGRNIHTQARQAAEEGLGTPSSMRDLYRDITGNPREANTLFNELSQKYAFKDLKKVMKFLMHSLGSDMKAKGPSIPRGQLHRLLNETRSLQAIMNVYRFFQGRVRLMKSMFGREGAKIPNKMNFEQMAKEFMGLCAERYPSSDKVKERAVKLGIEDWLLAKIIAFSQFRDAVREMAMDKIFRNLQHRDELYMAIIEALEDYEDELEDLEDEEEEFEDDFLEEDEEDEEEE